MLNILKFNVYVLILHSYPTIDYCYTCFKIIILKINKFIIYDRL